MKKNIIITILTVSLVSLGGVLVFADTVNPLQNKIIFLDAGHGGTSLGAQYPANSGSNGQVFEKDVNLAIVYALKQKLEDGEAKVVLSRVCDETIGSNKDRVDTAVEKCKQLDLNGDGQPDGKKCNALVSNHHNGNTDATHDGTLVIYNENQDKPLAVALHDSLISSLNLSDEGYDNGGYGLTVYDHLVSVLTEAYYITNTNEANYYISGTLTTVCQNSDGSDYQVRIGDRVNQEAEALYQGLYNYFLNLPSKPGKRQ